MRNFQILYYGDFSVMKCEIIMTKYPLTVTGPHWMQVQFKYNSCSVNSLRSSDAIWHCKSGSTLHQIMACHLSGTKPLHETMLIYCKWDPQEKKISETCIKVQILRKKNWWIKIQIFSLKKNNLKMFVIRSPLCLGLTVLNWYIVYTSPQDKSMLC